MVAVDLQTSDVKKADDAGDLVAAAASTLVFHNVIHWDFSASS